MDFGEIINRIWTLTNKSDLSFEDTEELDFYNTIFSIVKELITSGICCKQFPINFKICSIENAQKYAKKLGIKIALYNSELTIFFCK